MTPQLTNLPKIASKRFWPLFVALWMITFIPCLAADEAYDSTSGATSSIPPSPAVVTTEQAAVGSTVSSYAVRSPCDPDYWIVSTRHGRCEVESGQPCQFQVFRFDGPNPARETGLDELLSSLEPGVPVCIMSHGSFVTWDSMLNDSAHTYRWLRSASTCAKAHFIFYTWASEDGHCLPHIRVNALGRRASLNGFYLADLITKISPDHPICLIGHSHGTRIVASALHTMAGGILEGKMLACHGQLPRRIRVVFAAAALDHDWLNPDERYGRSLCSAEAVINLTNKYDFPLWFYPLRRPFSSRALAITGVTSSDRSKLGGLNQKIVNCEVSDLVSFGHIWAHYYRQPDIATAIRPYVYFDDEMKQ